MKIEEKKISQYFLIGLGIFLFFTFIFFLAIQDFKLKNRALDIQEEELALKYEQNMITK